MNLAFILLATPGLPKGDEIVSAFDSFACEGERLLQQEIEAQKPQAIQSLELELTPGGTVVVVAMPMPVPSAEAESSVRFSISSFGTGWKLPPHNAHLIVNLRPDDKSTEVASLSSFTSLLAAVAEASNAVGIYWGNAGATHDATFFISTARRKGIMPRITLWTGVSIARDEAGGLSLLSLGMKQLSLPELLLVAPKSAAKNALEVFFDLLSYAAQRGEPISEGDTVGRTADERLPVHYVPSPVDPSKKVWRVEIK